MESVHWLSKVLTCQQTSRKKWVSQTSACGKGYIPSSLMTHLQPQRRLARLRHLPPAFRSAKLGAVGRPRRLQWGPCTCRSRIREKQIVPTQKCARVWYDGVVHRGAGRRPARSGRYAAVGSGLTPRAKHSRDASPEIIFGGGALRSASNRIPRPQRDDRPPAPHQALGAFAYSL